jgi:hypothetical protein
MCLGGEPRKVVELYNLTKDFSEQRNLAREPEYRHHLQELQHWATQLIQEMVREGGTVPKCSITKQLQLELELCYSTNTRDGKGRNCTKMFHHQTTAAGARTRLLN